MARHKTPSVRNERTGPTEAEAAVEIAEIKRLEAVEIAKIKRSEAINTEWIRTLRRLGLAGIATLGAAWGCSSVSTIPRQGLLPEWAETLGLGRSLKPGPQSGVAPALQKTPDGEFDLPR